MKMNSTNKTRLRFVYIQNISTIKNSSWLQNKQIINITGRIISDILQTILKIQKMRHLYALKLNEECIR